MWVLLPHLNKSFGCIKNLGNCMSWDDEFVTFKKKKIHVE